MDGQIDNFLHNYSLLGQPSSNLHFCIAPAQYTSVSSQNKFQALVDLKLWENRILVSILYTFAGKQVKITRFYLICSFPLALTYMLRVENTSYCRIQKYVRNVDSQIISAVYQTNWCAAKQQKQPGQCYPAHKIIKLSNNYA